MSYWWGTCVWHTEDLKLCLKFLFLFNAVELVELFSQLMVLLLEVLHFCSSLGLSDSGGHSRFTTRLHGYLLWKTLHPFCCGWAHFCSTPTTFLSSQVLVLLLQYIRSNCCHLKEWTGDFQTYEELKLMLWEAKYDRTRGPCSVFPSFSVPLLSLFCSLQLEVTCFKSCYEFSQMCSTSS